MTKNKGKAKASKKAAKRKVAKKAAKQAVKRTIVTVVLDESASMNDGLDATISSVNEYIQSLKAKGSNVLFSLTKFNSVRTEVVQAGVPIAEAKGLTLENYRPDGTTPLFDTVAATVAETRIAAKDGKDSVLVVIVTDGAENASKEYQGEEGRTKIASLIREREKAKWTFVYIGADHDAFAAASSMGIRPANTVNYSKGNTVKTMQAVASATLRYNAKATRSAGPMVCEAFFTNAEKTDIAGAPAVTVKDGTNP